MGTKAQTTVQTISGTVHGVADGDLVRFRGIPYAAAPVGELRFAAPAAHPGWTGVRDASRPGPTPLLPPSSLDSSIPEPTTPGEEILNLSITAPREVDSSAPVYVWIHGGSYVAGTPNGGWFDGATLARSGVIVVAITYRLGFDGFGHIPHAPDNRALLDALAALRWVQDNIGQFGGDPSRVTLGGQSAGGGMVLALLAAPPAQGLFRAAIAHSAPLPDIRIADAHQVTAELARELGIGPALEQWRRISRADIVAAERRLKAGSVWSDLAQLRGVLSRQRPLTRFGPVVDTELVGLPLAALAAPDTRPLLLGTTAAEYNLVTTDLDPAFLRGAARPALAALGVPSALARAYPRAYPTLSTAHLLGQALTNRAFRMSAIQVAQARARAGIPAGLWDFRWHGAVGPARHCIDLPFAWDVLDGERVDRIAGEHPPRELAREMSGDIAEFIGTGTVPWPGFTAAAPTAKVYDTPSWLGRDPYRFERLALDPTVL
ncbi:MAG: carboxylesterase/lipase family protein [Beutenbergiaceae bacterium]